MKLLLKLNKNETTGLNVTEKVSDSAPFDQAPAAAWKEFAETFYNTI